MRRFTFRLEKVRDLRKWKEEISQQHFAAAHQRREEARLRLEYAEAEAELHNQQFGDRISKEFRAGDALVEHRSALRLKQNVADHTDKLQQREQEVEQRRGELVEASRDRKAIETLRERRLDEHKKNVERVEQAILDDVAGQRHARAAANRR
jgi:flagellar FliJ protein